MIIPSIYVESFSTGLVAGKSPLLLPGHPDPSLTYSQSHE